jgi:hypothetical protein
VRQLRCRRHRKTSTPETASPSKLLRTSGSVDAKLPRHSSTGTGGEIHASELRANHGLSAPYCLLLPESPYGRGAADLTNRDHFHSSGKIGFHLGGRISSYREISEEGPLTHWGEITHRKMAKKLKASPGAGILSKLPDVAAILPAGGNAAVSLIIENKVILGGEKPEGTIENLKEQMLNAQNVWPGASIVGLIFVAAVSHAKKPKYSDLLRRVVATTDKVFDGVLGFRWVR